MKKITFFFCLLISTAGFAQVNLEDFEGSPVLTGFEGLGGANIVANPSVDANNGSATVGELVVVQAGNPWQGANLIMQNNYIDVSLPMTNTVSVDVYSTTGFTMLARVADGQGGATDSAADAVHSGNGWETLTYTFNENLDSTGPANGEYGRIAFFPNWTGSGWNDPEIEITVYIDNLTAFAGGSLVMDPTPAGPAPLPTSPIPNTYSIYNDTNGYTLTWPFAYQFGDGIDGEVNLDGSGTNNAWKFNLGNGGFGQGEENTTGIIDNADTVTFDYWMTAPTNGAATGTGFRFVLISDAPAFAEVFYEIGTDEAAVTETWTTVSIPLSFFTNNGFNQSELFQWKIDPFGQSVDNNSILYLDNILITGPVPLLSVDDNTVSKFKAFPNPTTGDWNISNTSAINSIAVYDILGKQVISMAPNSLEVTIDASTLNPGMYFAKIEATNGAKTIKLIKE